MKKETDKEFKRRIMREATVAGAGFRCGECSRISYYRETDQWECGGSYCNPSSRACGLFRLSEGGPVEGTFPSGSSPCFGVAREKALKTIAQLDREAAEEKASMEKEHDKVTNFEWLMKRFRQDRDMLIDYLQCSDCGDCEHENECEVAYKHDFVSCREFLRKWLNEKH